MLGGVKLADVAYVGLAFILTIVFCLVYSKTGSLWKSWIVTLIFGKLLVGVFWAAGINKTLFTIWIINRKLGTMQPFEFTANLLIMLSLASTLIIALSWNWIKARLPSQLQNVISQFEMSGGERR